MKLSIELAPNGGLAVYLPGALHATTLTLGKAEEMLVTILRDAKRWEAIEIKPLIGTVAAPSEAQLNHWQNHSTRNVRGCPWCKPTPNLGFQAIDAFIPKEKTEKRKRR